MKKLQLRSAGPAEAQNASNSKKPRYAGWSQEQLIAEVERLRKRKKYGLVWEPKDEDVVEQCKKELPVLKEVAGKAITQSTDTPTNILIEGDNYHALSVLNYTHKGKISAIYADPPYNTGARDWKYNNDYVDANDGYRHSKWLSMMQVRLKIARNLLREDGIICVTIDDYEMPHLVMLMEEIFGEANHLGTVVIRNNPSGRSTERGFSIAHEYGVFFSKSARARIGRLPRNEEQIGRYSEKDDSGTFEWVNFRKHGATREESPKMFYPIFISRTGLRVPKMKWNENKDEWLLQEKPKKIEAVIYPIDENGFHRRWKWSVDRVRQEIAEMKVSKDRSGKLAVYIKSRMNDAGMLPLTWWDRKEYSATAYGTNLLKSIFSKLQVFSYPKSVYAVMDSFRVMANQKDAVILDFFAGSGTTGHAVLELNKEDGGNRRFILCTNNENNIATDVCYPRVAKVIKGYKSAGGEKVAGLGGNLRYFCTAFVGAEPNDKNKEALTRQATEMLCVREDTFEPVKETKSIKIFKSAKRYTSIVFDEDALPALKKEIAKLGGVWSVYIFSLGDDTFDEEFENMKQRITVAPIPEAILRVYRRLFQ